MNNYYSPEKFWFCKDSNIPIPKNCVIAELNKELQKNDPEKYNSGFRFIDMEESGFNYTGSRYQLWKLDDNGKIIINFLPFSELEIVSNI